LNLLKNEKKNMPVHSLNNEVAGLPKGIYFFSALVRENQAVPNRGRPIKPSDFF